MALHSRLVKSWITKINKISSREVSRRLENVGWKWILFRYESFKLTMWITNWWNDIDKLLTRRVHNRWYRFMWWVISICSIKHSKKSYFKCKKFIYDNNIYLCDYDNWFYHVFIWYRKNNYSTNHKNGRYN